MERKYLKEMELEEQVDIILNNNMLRSDFEELYYSYLMDVQADQGELMLGKNYPGIDIKDHYSSFFLVLIDWEKFFNNLDSDYLNSDGLKLYADIKNLYNEYINEDMYSEKFGELEIEIEDKCKELLSICENQLHEYEHYSEEDMIEELKYHIDNGDYENYYIIDNDKNVVYEDITKIYK